MDRVRSLERENARLLQLAQHDYLTGLYNRGATQEKVEQLLRQSQSGQFCVGETPTLADCCLVPQWANALRMNCDLSGYPRCKAVYDACTQLPAFIAAAPENQQDKISA